MRFGSKLILIALGITPLSWKINDDAAGYQGASIVDYDLDYL
jgi:hypothetical protein